MAVIARITDEVSTPTTLIPQKDFNLSTKRFAAWSATKKDCDKVHPDEVESRLPFANSDSFFYLSSTDSRKTAVDIVVNKINTKREFNNINSRGVHSVCCQRMVNAGERTCNEASRKVASDTAAMHHRDSSSYLCDKTNDLISEMETRCTFDQPSARSYEVHTDCWANSLRRQSTDDAKMKCLVRCRLPPKFRGTSHICNESSNSFVKLCSIFIAWIYGRKRCQYPTLSGDASRKRRFPNFTSLFKFFIFTILLLSISNVDLVAGRKHNHRRGGGPRFPRDSGFNRGAKRSAFSSQKCEDITVPICKDIGYNRTDMSLSMMNKFTQDRAKKELDLFKPLLDRNCSAEMKLFLCSLYTPICMDGYRQFLPPCRFICESAKRGCLPILRKYNYGWPEHLRCEKFPVYATKRSMCMHFNLTKPREEMEKKEKGDIISTTAKTKQGKQDTSRVSTRKTLLPNSTTAITLPSIPAMLQNSSTCAAQCREPMVKIVNTDDPLYNKVSTGNILNCAIPCKSPYFTESEVRMGESTIKWFSVVCFVVTLLTVTTYLVNMDRFEYPQRPIIFMSVCYLFVSVGFLIRIVVGHEAVGCDYKTGHVLYHSTGPALCVTVFLLIYFFSMASAVWWVILSMTWFLAAALKWGNEAIAKYFHVYHVVAWIFPSILTVLVLVLSCVDGDSLSGICFVGNQDVQNLRGFVLFPFVICFAGGSLFLLVGFISLIRIRSRVRKDGKKTGKFERLIIRIGCFNVLYMLSAAILVGCYFYEQENRSSWEVSHNCHAGTNSDSQRPSFPVLMARHLMTLVIGILNGVWICSPKTLDSWKGFYRKCMCCLYSTSCPPPCGSKFDKVNVRVDQNANDKWPCHSSNRRDSPKTSTGNRNGSYRSRHSSANQECNNPTRSRSSRNSSVSRNTSSRQDSCMYCSHSARTSTNRMDSTEPVEKRKRKRSRRRPSESYSQASRRKRNEQEEDSRQMLCNSNTTSTDGSDRLVVPGSENCGNVEPQFPVIDHRAHPYGYPKLTASLQSSIISNTAPVHKAESSRSNEHSDSCLDIGERYVINCDNLPPPIPRPCAMGHSCMSSCSHSQCCDRSNSVTSLCKSDGVGEMGASLLCQDSEFIYHCNEDTQPYYRHFHDQHCPGEILS